MVNSNERPLISFAHGRHFDGTIFDDVRGELDENGWLSIAPTFDVEDGAKDLDEHARLLADKEAATGATEVVRVGWSWGANVVLRDFGVVPVRRAILPAGAFHPDSLTWAGSNVPAAQHNIHYMAYEHNPSKEAYREIARLCLFTDEAVDDATVMEWADKMRDHPRRHNEPKLRYKPKFPLDYIVLRNDKAVLNQRDIAGALQKRAKVHIEGMDSDHVPMKSHPSELAEIIMRRAAVINFEPVRTA